MIAFIAFEVSHTVSSTVLANEVVGPLVGTVDATTAEILFRPSAAATKLRLTVIDAKNIPVRSVDAESQSKNDFVAKFSIGGLLPHTTYRYRIDQMGSTAKNLIAADDQHSFTTANPSRSDHSVTVAFVSCVDIEPNEIWKDMNKAGVDTICLMGDTPYIDSVDLGVVRTRHRRFLQMPELAALMSHTPTIGTWDDHDFGANNGNGLKLMRGKINTRRGFVEYRAHSQYGNGSGGVYHKIDLGMMEVFLLDPRYFSQTEKSPVDAKQPTCFGRQQWEWLLEKLKASKAPFKVLACGAIWQDKKNAETDDMFTYWYERDALLDYIASEKIPGVMLLGGDIHVSRHLVHPQRVGYDLHDFIISPGHKRTITQLDVYHPSLRWSLVEGHQFLTLTADGTQKDPRLIARYRQGGGTVNREVVIPLSELTRREETGLKRDLRGYWSFDEDLSNQSKLGSVLDAKPYHGASIAKNAGRFGGAAKFDRSKQQFLNVARNGLDDNSDRHAFAMWVRPTSLPRHGSNERSFLIESTAEGKPSDRSAWHLSLGLRASGDPDKVNLQLYTHTLVPAAQPQAAPTAKSQGGFDFLVARNTFDQWTHISCAFDSERLTLYLNGKRAAVHQLPTPGPASEFGGLIIGGHRAGVGRNFDGLIDEVGIWSRLLSSNEVRQLAASRISSTEATSQ
jgi:alkaline phosphatase D